MMVRCIAVASTREKRWRPLADIVHARKGGARAWEPGAGSRFDKMRRDFLILRAGAPSDAYRVAMLLLQARIASGCGFYAAAIEALERAVLQGSVSASVVEECALLHQLRREFARCSELLLTVVNLTPRADTFLPEFEAEFELAERLEKDSEMEVRRYVRRA